MCVSFKPARFSGTTVYAGLAQHPVHGSVHVCGYQNMAQSIGGQPNAMILHFPAADAMDEDNNIDVSNAENVLRDMVTAVKPVSFRGADSLRRGGSKSAPVHIFDTGIYTVVMSSSPDAIRKALKKVDARKRSTIGKALFDHYKSELKGYSFAVCCFNTADAKSATPIMFWYRSRFPNSLVAPGLDAHDGNPPNMATPVETDHWVIFGAPGLDAVGGHAVRYTDADARDQLTGLPDFLPTHVLGRQFMTNQPNGDFVVSLSDLNSGRLPIKRKLLK